MILFRKPILDLQWAKAFPNIRDFIVSSSLPWLLFPTFCEEANKVKCRKLKVKDGLTWGDLKTLFFLESFIWPCKLHLTNVSWPCHGLPTDAHILIFLSANMKLLPTQFLRHGSSIMVTTLEIISLWYFQWVGPMFHTCSYALCFSFLSLELRIYLKFIETSQVTNEKSYTLKWGRESDKKKKGRWFHSTDELPFSATWYFFLAKRILNFFEKNESWLITLIMPCREDSSV